MPKQVKELRNMSDDELKRRHQELRVELMRANAHGGDAQRGVNAPHAMFIRNTRREIARILTILEEQRLKKAPQTLKANRLWTKN